MTMSKEEVQSYVMTYLEAMDCQVLEKSPAHVTVKLSVEADKALTNRPYYWGFVDRTGAPAETMSFTFIFDPEAYDKAEELQRQKDLETAAELGMSNPQDTALARSYGHVPPLPVLGPGRVLREQMIYGCSRLNQIFTAAKDGGGYVNLFELPSKRQVSGSIPKAYEPWLAVCFKIELSCDLKREELHFLGISLLTGRTIEDFGQILDKRELSPRLPENMHVQGRRISLEQAAASLEKHIHGKLRLIDYSWAEAAKKRLEEELRVLGTYYEDLLKEQTEEEQKLPIQEQYHRRRSEMKWQYEPKINVSTISCGILHLR